MRRGELKNAKALFSKWGWAEDPASPSDEESEAQGGIASGWLFCLASEQFSPELVYSPSDLVFFVDKVFLDNARLYR